MAEDKKSLLCTEFPAQGLRDPFRHITGHNEAGESVFLTVRKSHTQAMSP